MGASAGLRERRISATRIQYTCGSLGLQGWRILLFFFVVRMRGKGFGMQLAREILDGGNDSRCWAVHSVADHGEAPVAHGIKAAPSGARSDDVELILSAVGMGLREHKKFRLQANHFLETHLRPVLLRIDYGGGARSHQSVGNKSVLTDGNQWIRPHDEENMTGRNAVQSLL